MFNPKNLPSLKEKYRTLLDISDIALTSTDRTVLYASYFSLIERIKLMEKFTEEVNLCIEDVKPFITHKNREIQELLHGCYQVLKKIVDDIPVKIKELEALKVNIIEDFNKNFETQQEVN
jgi:hypothetical protein